LVLDQSLV